MIIGIAGEKRHGKDTVANYLVEKHGFQKIAFANKLRKVCSTTFPDVDFYDEANKETPFMKPIQISKIHVDSIYDQLIEDGYQVSGEQYLAISLTMYEKVWFTSVRDILQFIGTDVLRNHIDADYHYNSVARVIKGFGNYVISDVRFKNEREGLKRDFNSSVILVERPSLQRNETSTHASENSLGDKSEYDLVITNDSTLEHLFKKVDVILNGLK